MKIKCPGCGMTGNLNNPEQGRSITCPKCQLSFKLGTKAEIIEESPPEDIDLKEYKSYSTKQKMSLLNSPVKYPHAILVLCIMIILVGMGYIANKSCTQNLIDPPPLTEIEKDRIYEVVEYVFEDNQYKLKEMSKSDYASFIVSKTRFYILKNDLKYYSKKEIKKVIYERIDWD